MSMSLNRRRFLKTSAGTLGALAVTNLACEKKVSPRNIQPNILLIYADDLGYGDLSCYGGDIPTPNIDAIADSGIRFTSFYVTSPACTPSRYSLLTGCFPHRSRGGLNKVYMPGDEIHFDPCEVTLAEYLKALDYKTGIFGKWHMGKQKRQYWPDQHGFDTFTGFPGGCIDYYRHTYGPLGHDWVVDNEPQHEEGYATDLIGTHADQFIRQNAKKAEPFFTYIAFNAPHYGKSDPKDVPDNTCNLLTTTYQGQKVMNTLQAPEKYLQKFSHIKNKARQYYCAMVAAMDDQVGRLLDTLEELGIRENTMIWFISDNGGYSETYEGHADNGKFRGEKATCYEGGIRIPAMVSWPGRIQSNQVRDQVLCNIDLVPTLAAITGFETALNDKSIDGRNISDVLWYQAQPDRELIYRYSDRVAYRKGDWKLVNESDLFNIANDPTESTNLVATHPEKLQHMLSAQKKFVKSLTPYTCKEQKG
ncbi:sulfatase-like hydrolase/transferase [candidate division KSB1 bacterium]|nr:sulfatase-like hydrolase/transferase [candidate division KSB1 bacterium]